MIIYKKIYCWRMLRPIYDIFIIISILKTSCVASQNDIFISLTLSMVTSDERSDSNILKWLFSVASAVYPTNYGRVLPLQWRHTGRDGVSNLWRLGCLLDRLYMHISKKTSTLHVTGLCERNPPITTQSAHTAENVSIWWRHHGALPHFAWSCAYFIHMMVMWTGSHPSTKTLYLQRLLSLT